MLSILLYGRNDHHEYQYHKRLSLSLNALAELLEGPTDEIVFVDYNSPNDFPTIIEAIRDTLTPKALARLRLFRVRPEHHRGYRPVTEAVARNVALRRSNPQNRWILSTNPDMLFVPEDPTTSLTAIAASLPDGFYLLPRFEIPEHLWDTALDRKDPIGNLHFLRTQARALFLNTEVKMEGFLQYDNPGDFQLLPRKDLIAMEGFDEAMIHRSHIDANLCKRASLFIAHHGTIPSLSAFHCNHTHQPQQLHHPFVKENCWNRFVNNSKISPCLAKKNWGLANELIEEICLFPSHSHLQSLQTILGQKSLLTNRQERLLHPRHYNHWAYTPESIFPFLADHLCYLPPSSEVHYFGNPSRLVQMMKQYLQHHHPLIPFHCYSSAVMPSFEKSPSSSHLWIFDFGIEGPPPQKPPLEFQKRLNQLIALLKKKQLAPGTKCIGINVTYTDIHAIFNAHFELRHFSLVPGLCYGYVPLKSRKAPRHFSRKKKWVAKMHYWTVRWGFGHMHRLHKYLNRSKVLSFLRKTY